MIGDELKVFLESGVSVIVGTRNSELVPELARGWGPRVAPDRKSVSFCIARAAGRQTLRNLEDNGPIAATFSSPVSYRTVQLKGGHAEVAEPDMVDLTAIERHRDEFCRVNAALGVDRELVLSFFRLDVGDPPAFIRIRLEPAELFDQTPGAGAGEPL